MENKKRLKLIDYDEIRTLFDEEYKKTAQLIRDGETHLDNLAEGFTEADRVIWKLPTVDAVVLPCKIGTQVWLTKWWDAWELKWEKQNEPLPRNIHHFDITKDGVFAHFRDGCINIKYFGEIVFLTKEEAKAAIAKMDGGNEDG